jgi:nitrate/nitrite transporter NarK
MGTMYLITTIAMIGPVTGGLVADKYGGFENVFRFYAIILAICLVAVALMKPPKMTAREISPDEG